MKFLFKYATRGRPKLFKKTLGRWIERLSKRHEWLFMVTLDSDDPTASQVIDHINKMDNVVYQIGEHNGKIDAINADMYGLVFDILVVVSDDMLPNAIGYDDIIARNMREYFPKLDGALHYPDGIRSDLITCSIMGRRLYEHFGYIYHPDYQAQWCDNEFTDVVKQLGKYQYINRNLITHHWRVDDGKTFRDDIMYRDDKLFESDKQVYERRKNEGFTDVLKEVA